MIILSERDIAEVINYLHDKIPVKYSMEKNDLIYDKKSIYYKAYKYIMELRKKLEER